MKLADFLVQEMNRNKWSKRKLEAHTGVSRGAIDKILDGSTEAPTLETLARFSETLKVPFWRIMEMAGPDMGVPPTLTGQVQRVLALAQAMPQLEVVVDQILELRPEEMEGVLAYLEALKRRRDAAGLGPGDPAE